MRSARTSLALTLHIAGRVQAAVEGGYVAPDLPKPDIDRRRLIGVYPRVNKMRAGKSGEIPRQRGRRG